jgi:hypothetical protein
MLVPSDLAQLIVRTPPEGHEVWATYPRAWVKAHSVVVESGPTNSFADSPIRPRSRSSEIISGRGSGEVPRLITNRRQSIIGAALGPAGLKIQTDSKIREASRTARQKLPIKDQPDLS